MRYVILLLSLDVACAQTPPATGPNLRSFTWEQPPLPPSARWKLFPSDKSPTPAATPLPLLPVWNGGQAPVARRVPRLMALNLRPQPCAIPLTNVARPAGVTPTIRRVPRTNARLPMKEVTPPAPSCDDVK